MKLTKHVDVDRYKYSGYGMALDRKEFFSHLSGRNGKNVTNFGVDMSSSSHIDNKKIYILILRKGRTQGLEHTLSAEKMYSMKFTKENTKFSLSLHYNGTNSYLFVNGKTVHKFTVKDSEINPYELCLGNISKD